MSASTDTCPTCGAPTPAEAPPAAAAPPAPQPPHEPDAPAPWLDPAREGFLNPAALTHMLASWRESTHVGRLGHGAPGEAPPGADHVPIVRDGSLLGIGEALASVHAVLRELSAKGMAADTSNARLVAELGTLNAALRSASGTGAGVGDVTVTQCNAVLDRWALVRQSNPGACVALPLAHTGHWGSASQLLAAWVAHELCPMKVTHPLLMALMSPGVGAAGVDTRSRMWYHRLFYGRTQALAWHTIVHSAVGALQDFWRGVGIPVTRQYLPATPGASRYRLLTAITPGWYAAGGGCRAQDAAAPVPWVGGAHVAFWWHALSTVQQGGVPQQAPALEGAAKKEGAAEAAGTAAGTGLEEVALEEAPVQA